MRRRRATVSLGGSLSTSFLDVLCNGLGAGILLLVLIAALPIRQTVNPSPSGPFIRISWTVSGDPAALLAIVIVPPNGAQIPIGYQALQDGSHTRCDTAYTMPSGGITLYGVTLAGATAALVDRSSSRSAANPTDRTYLLWIREPLPGTWRMTVSYFNRDDSMLRPVSERLNVVSTVFSSNSDQSTVYRSSLGFGERFPATTITIPPYDMDNRDSQFPSCI